MTLNLFDDNAWQSLRPLSFTRPVADLRIGILTIAQKWEQHLDAAAGFITQKYLSEKYPAKSEATLFINGSVCPDAALLDAISALKSGQALKQADLLIAYKLDSGTVEIDHAVIRALEIVSYPYDFVRIFHPEDIFKKNDVEIRKDYELLTKGRVSAKLSATNVLLGENIFVEEGVEAECATFNSLNGPIYLGQNSQVWEGSNVRGTFALCHDSQLKMGAKVYGQTTIGPFCRVGGEVNNAVIWGYSSKGHEGYLGNSVLGQWCNIGADSNNSNLKNNYAEVRLWDYNDEHFRPTGLQFCGLIMADHAKCGINTMFNTGTVAGVSANIFGSGFPRNFIPDFAWGGAHGYDVYHLNKMFETTEKVYKRRNIVFDEVERELLRSVFELTEPYRQFK